MAKSIAGSPDAAGQEVGEAECGQHVGGDVGFVGDLESVFRELPAEGVQAPTGAFAGTRWDCFGPGLPARAGARIVAAPGPEVVRDDPGPAGRQDVAHHLEDAAGLHVLNRLRMDDCAKMCTVFVRKSVGEHVLEAGMQDGDARVVADDVLHLEAVGRQARDFVPGFVEESEHAAHPGACVQHRVIGAVDPLDQLFGIAELGAVEGVEADCFGRRFRVVEVAVVEEVAGEHPVVEQQLGVRMHRWDAAVRPSPPEPPGDMVRQEGAPEDLLQDPAAAQAGGARVFGWGSEIHGTIRGGHGRAGSVDGHGTQESALHRLDSTACRDRVATHCPTAKPTITILR